MYKGGINLNYAYENEQQVLIVKDILERAKKREGSIRELSDKLYNISRKTFYNYRDYTEDILTQYGYELRHIYDLSQEDLKAMVNGTYQNETSTKQSTKEPTKTSTNESIEQSTKQNTGQSTKDPNEKKETLINDLYKDLEKKEIKEDDLNKTEKEKAFTDEKQPEEKKSNGWFKYAIYGVIALIAVILVLFLSKPKEKKEETVNTQSSYKDEFEGFVMF